MRLVVNEAFNDLLRRNRIFTNSDGRPRWRAGEIVTVDDNVVIEPYVHLMKGRTFPRRMGAFTYSYSSIDPCFQIGRYCSIAPEVLPMGSQHPMEWTTTSPFSYFPGTLVAFDAYFGDRKLQRPPLLPFDGGLHHITIGNDVWVGGSVLIKRGVTIGHGAVIAARAVVTRDVPPYAIVAGTPARILRYRFTEPMIERLIASQWWDYGPDILSPLDVRDPERLPDRLGDAIAKGAKPLDLTVVKAQDMIRAVETKSA